MWRQLALCFFVGNVCADCNSNGCNVSASDPIKRMYLTHLLGGQVYVEVSSGKQNLDCILLENKFLVLKSTHLLFKETYATLLSGGGAGKNMHIRIKSGSTNCEISYVWIYF